MGISAIDHWVIIVKDLEKSVAFYRKLGLKETWQGKAGGESSRPVFRINDAQLIKFYAADRYEIESPSGAPTMLPDPWISVLPGMGPCRNSGLIEGKQRPRAIRTVTPVRR